VAVSYKRQGTERSSQDAIVIFDFDLITYILISIDVQSTQFVTDMCPSVKLQEELGDHSSRVWI